MIILIQWWQWQLGYSNCVTNDRDDYQGTEWTYILTKAVFLCYRWPENRSQLLGVSREHQLTAPVVVGIQEVRDRDDALRLGRMPSFVNKNVREMITGKTGRN